jgi:membrane associated rhomboid family serine protease
VRPPAEWNNARVTLVLAGATVLAWFLVSLANMGLEAAVWGGFIPARASDLVREPALAPVILTPLTATLVHANFLHIAFNLLMLLFCGRAVEPIIGGKGLAALYIIGAYAAAAAQWLVDPASTAPMIGASGAISALLGAYAMFFGRHRIRIRNDSLAVLVNALWLAAAWIGLQLLIGLTAGASGMAVAIAAHIGGFLVGLLLARPILKLRWRRA